ncbi:SagB/ThcOx family dehydrogenase [Spirillospora sp. NBC_01491]|uniref:SagB/ThcOx family dehydrogenase n=1 Tax=Spirillospora sp. NBC_01491 TaxID=2976007 RepID=UPI002E37CEA2|nr:SagB family peptide dehydrogenase [Spirillospora sp. NBC_01491]
MTGQPDSETFTERFSLVPGVYSATTSDGLLRLVIGSRGAGIGTAEPWRLDILRRLAKEPCTERELEAAGAGPDALAEFVGALRIGGWLETEISGPGGAGPHYALRPTRRPSSPDGPVPDGPAPDDLVLSRFAIAHRERDTEGLVVESPLAWASARLHDPALLGTLTGASPSTPSPAAGTLAHRFRGDLFRAGLAVPAALPEDEPFDRRQWSPHELWFHWRSRIGERDSLGRGYGRTRWADGLYEPVPARREPYQSPAIDLHRPDLEALRSRDPALTAVVEDRRSIRANDDDAPITARQLGEFLYRCARVRETPGPDGSPQLSKPYPAGGSVYELELYPVVRRASGLAPGVYHYDGHDHALRLVRGPGRGMERLLATARHGTFERLNPQVLIVVTARFGRLMWTYEQMPYSLILKHVGVLYQSMYLAATAMGLAPCGLGGGDSETFNEVTGSGFTAESAVGEFMLGSRPADGS